LGVRVERGVTMHGFAINLEDDLEPFARINPCGVPGCSMTSVEGETGARPALEDALAAAFAKRFGLPLASPLLS
jgi:lipoyl(octanoyl) transferase